MKQLFTALAVASLASPAMASVTVDIDKKLVTYANDGDGMQYLVSKGEKTSSRYHDLYAYPLGADRTRRYDFPAGETGAPVAHEKPGPRGLTFSRPLADGEIAKVQADLMQITEAMGSGALALDEGADPGPVIGTYDAWHSESREDCKITIHEKAINICGAKFGRAGVVNWTMFQEGYHYYGTFYGSFNYTIGYQSREGRKAVSFRFVNAGASRKFMQAFSAWSGSNPQRI